MRENTTSLSAMSRSRPGRGRATARSIMRKSNDARPAITDSMDAKIYRPGDLGEEAQRAEVHRENRHVPAFLQSA